MAGMEHTGHCASLPSHTRLAQSMQKKLWPHGTNAWVTLPSPHTKHLVVLMVELRRESAGLVLLGGDGRVGAATVGKVQMFDNPALLSKLGESPRPSSLSLEAQIAPRSARPPELDELLLEQEPALEKAPELPVEEVILLKGSFEAGSLNSVFNPGNPFL